MLKKLWRNKKGTAEIVGTALFLVILVFFFANVFLFHDRASREMDQVIADRMNSAVQLVTGSGSGNLVPCTAGPTFYGFGSLQRDGEFSPPHQTGLSSGPPYGMIVSGSLADTTTQNNTYQVLSETGHMEGSPLHNSDYMALNATYEFDVNIHTNESLRLTSAITFSFYGYSSDSEGEAVDVYIYNVQRKLFEGAGLKILNDINWYNVTIPNPQSFVNTTSGTIKINYLSDTNGWYWDERNYLNLYIDYQSVSVDSSALSVSDVGGRDLRLERLWITEVSNDNHMYIDLTKDDTGNPIEVWIAAGSSTDIAFGSTLSYDNKTLTINYTPVSGKVNFKVLTNLGNMATITYNFP